MQILYLFDRCRYIYARVDSNVSYLCISWSNITPYIPLLYLIVPLYLIAWTLFMSGIWHEYIMFTVTVYNEYIVFTYPVVRHFPLMIVFQVQRINVERIHHVSRVLEPEGQRSQSGQGQAI